MAVTNPIPEYFDAWPHEPTAIIREALREYVGDGGWGGFRNP